MDQPISEDSQSTALQPALFPEEQAYEAAERRGEWTLERLRVRRPEILVLIARMCAEGLSTLSIARACQVSPNTVTAVRRLEQKSIDEHKQELLTMTRSAARLTLERVIECAPTMKPGEASVAFGIVTEKMLLLGGEATTIVGTASDKMKHADFNDLISSLPQADAHVIEMGSPGEKEEQRVPAGSDDSTAENADSDSESDVYADSSKVNTYPATGSATEQEPASEAEAPASEGSDQGGAGVRRRRGGHQS
ncbi:MAG: hypothetical protein ACOYM3_19230 [Terrimicrobiaceae bacterium]